MGASPAAQLCSFCLAGAKGHHSGLALLRKPRTEHEGAHATRVSLQGHYHRYHRLRASPMHGLAPPFVEVDEGAMTLEALLSFIHPNIPCPTFPSMDILISILRAAQKYATDQVVLTLGSELVRSRVVNGKTLPSFAETDPLRVFAAARELGLQTDSQIATVATLDVNLNSAAASAEVERMPRMSYREVVRLRKERKDWLKTPKWWTISVHQPGYTAGLTSALLTLSCEPRPYRVCCVR